MATYFNDLSNALFRGETIRPQSFTSTGAGLAVDVRSCGGNLLNALLSVGAVNTLTSFNVKMQASKDNSNWDDISGATFTSVTAANATEVISFQMPVAASATADPYIYARAYCTLTGTAVLAHIEIVGLKHMPNPEDGYVAAPPTIN